MLINLILASSNLLGVPVVVKFYFYNKFLSATIVSTVICASTLMHLTESKHDLKPTVFTKYSNWFLNLDRLITITVGYYTVNKFLLLARSKQLALLPDIITAFIAMMVGEIKTNNSYHNNIIYPLLHCYWHVQVYLRFIKNTIIKLIIILIIIFLFV